MHKIAMFFIRCYPPFKKPCVRYEGKYIQIMKVKSTKPKGERIFKCTKFNHGNTNIKSKRPFWIEPIGGDWWFSIEKGEWYSGYDNMPKGGGCSSYYAMTYDGFNDIYSLKAAKRKIAKWNVPKGTKFRVGLPFIGYDFTITKP